MQWWLATWAAWFSNPIIEWLRAIDATVKTIIIHQGQLERQLEGLALQLEDNMGELEDRMAQMSAQVGQVEEVLTAEIGEVNAAIQALKDQLGTQGALTPEQRTAFDEVSARLTNLTSRIAGIVNADAPPSA